MKREWFRVSIEAVLLVGITLGCAPPRMMSACPTTHAGMSTTEFEAIVSDWVITARHPELDRAYADLVYQPMLEMLEWTTSGPGATLGVFVHHTAPTGSGPTIASPTSVGSTGAWMKRRRAVG